METLLLRRRYYRHRSGYYHLDWRFAHSDSSGGVVPLVSRAEHFDDKGQKDRRRSGRSGDRGTTDREAKEHPSTPSEVRYAEETLPDAVHW